MEELKNELMNVTEKEGTTAIDLYPAEEETETESRGFGKLIVGLGLAAVAVGAAVAVKNKDKIKAKKEEKMAMKLQRAGWFVEYPEIVADNVDGDIVDEEDIVDKNPGEDEEK